MKSIKLTKRQEKKLLKMCKKLFPEYDFRIQKEIFGKELSVQFGKKTNDLYENSIHWFEFCYGILLSKIFNHKDYPHSHIGDDDSDGRIDFSHEFSWFVKFHPVDYLYKHFKLLKK